MVVDLWANLPPQAPKMQIPPPAPPEPQPLPAKKIEPKPVAPAPIEKADISLKDKRLKEDKPKPAPPKPIPQQQRKPEPLKPEQLKQDQMRQAEAQQEQIQAELARLAQAKQSAAQQSVVNEYSERIKSKIRQKLNRALCGDGNPQLNFDIALLPTGQILGNPVLRKGSGIPACDKAVENAILQSDPLPVPPQPEIFNYFRDLHLNFKPNE